MRKLLPLVLVLIILIPAVIAIVSYRNTLSDPPDVGTVSAMKLVTLSGREYDLRAEEDSEIIDIFVAMMQDTTKVTSLPIQFTGRHYTVSFAAKSDVLYKFYMTANPEVCYYTDDYGIYKLKPAAALKFLQTSYASDLYTAASFPTLTLSGQPVAPTSLEWFYETYSGHYARFDETDVVTAETVLFELTGGIDLSFSEAPSYSEITVTNADGTNELFRGTAEQFASFDLSGIGTVAISIDADYPELPGSEAYGHLVYRFSAKVTKPAEFYLSTTSFNVVGGLVAVTAYNVADPTAIAFSSEPAMSFTPQFFAVPGEAYCVALIPLPYGMTPGNYQLRFTYGGITASAEMSVAKFNRTIDKKELTVSQAIYDSYYNDEARATFASETAAAAASSSAEQLWEGAFGLVFPHKSIKVMYAQTRVIYAGKKSTGTRFTQESLVYKQTKGTDVPAANSGVVVYAGHTDFGGWTVILEHGYGLKTWYMHMDSAAVAVGDTVGKGQSVGTTGAAGFFTTEYDGVEYAMSVFGTFFAPYDLWPDSDDRAWRGGIPFYTK